MNRSFARSPPIRTSKGESATKAPANREAARPWPRRAGSAGEQQQRREQPRGQEERRLVGAEAELRQVIEHPHRKAVTQVTFEARSVLHERSDHHEFFRVVTENEASVEAQAEEEGQQEENRHGGSGERPGAALVLQLGGPCSASLRRILGLDRTVAARGTL
jgi:hypothetical protein